MATSGRVLKSRMAWTSVGVVALSLSAICAPAAAGVYPAFEFRVQELTSASDDVYNPVGNPIFDGFEYTLFADGPGFEINGSVMGDDVVPTARIQTAMDIANTSGQTLEFIITMTMPMTSSFGPDWVTSNGWALTAGGLASLPGMSMWTLLIDGDVATTLFDDPVVLNEPDNMSAGPIFGSSDPIMNSFSIQIAFSLEAGGVVGITGGAFMIPAPGAVSVLLAGLFVGGSRRRRA